LDNNATQNKRLLILTGPQGSGNHVLSRVFSWHPKVQGWKALLNKYWVPSDQEPFAEFWVYPERLTAEHFEHSEYFFANVSVPFFYDGVRQEPKIREVAERAQSFGIEVVVAIVCRDKNINAHQQQRVGGEVTLYSAINYFQTELLPNFECHFISNETFFLWHANYLDYLAKLLRFPIALDQSQEMIDANPNKKYVHAVKDHWLDEEIRAGRQPFAVRTYQKLKEK